jgi:uncharacterized Ntn-hydrolase superfamily protein
MDRDTVWPAMAKAFESAQGDLAARCSWRRSGGGLAATFAAARARRLGGEGVADAGHDTVVSLRRDHPTPLVELRRLLEVHRAYDEMNQATRRWRRTTRR